MSNYRYIGAGGHNREAFVLADPTLAKQAFTNLVYNAVRCNQPCVQATAQG